MGINNCPACGVCEENGLSPRCNSTNLCPSCREALEVGREAREFIEQVARQKIGTDDDFPQEDYESCDWEGGFGYVVEQARRIMAKEALKGDKGYAEDCECKRKIS